MTTVSDQVNESSADRGERAESRDVNPSRRKRSPGDTRSDEELFVAYRLGDRSCFAELVERYRRELFHFLVRFLGDRAAAEDVFQETFLQVHQSAAQFDASRSFRPWLFTIAANKARDRYRSQARRPTVPLEAEVQPTAPESGAFAELMEAAVAPPDEPMAKEELREQVHRVVNTMPEHLREVLLLSYFHGFPYRQIAEILDIPLGTVKSRLHAAVAAFAAAWAMSGNDGADNVMTGEASDPPPAGPDCPNDPTDSPTPPTAQCDGDDCLHQSRTDESYPHDREVAARPAAALRVLRCAAAMSESATALTSIEPPADLVTRTLERAGIIPRSEAGRTVTAAPTEQSHV